MLVDGQRELLLLCGLRCSVWHVVLVDGQRELLLLCGLRCSVSCSAGGWTA